MDQVAVGQKWQEKLLCWNTFSQFKWWWNTFSQFKTVGTKHFLAIQLVTKHFLAIQFRKKNHFGKSNALFYPEKIFQNAIFKNSPRQGSISSQWKNNIISSAEPAYRRTTFYMVMKHFFAIHARVQSYNVVTSWNFSIFKSFRVTTL